MLSTGMEPRERASLQEKSIIHVDRRQAESEVTEHSTLVLLLNSFIDFTSAL